MTNTHASHNLKALVRQAKATANHVLNPLPLAPSGLLGVDEHILLRGLQSRETLSGFHPFADLSCPLPEGASQDTARSSGQIAMGNDRQYLAGNGNGNQQTVSAELDNAGSPVSSVTVLNQQFTDLVEQVFRQLGSASSAATAIGRAGSGDQRSRTAGHSKNRGSNGGASSKASGSGNVPAHPSANAVGNSSATLRHPPTLAERDSGINNGSKTGESGSHPVFQQLESLVTFLEGDYQRFPNADAPAKPLQSSINTTSSTADRQQSHLADLTRLLIKGNEVSSGWSQVTEKVPHKAQLHRLQDSSSLTRDSRQPAGKQHSAEKDSDSRDYPSQHASELGRMPDLLRRNPNMESSESTLAAAGFQGLSPTVTQRMADALNDYLQEQAERHGVDLS